MIDWTRVEELRAEFGSDEFAEVVTLFLEEADEVIQRLSIGLDLAALEADLHFLKGSALNLGFSALAALCQESERRAASGDRAVDLDTVHEVYIASKTRFRAGSGGAHASA